MRTLSVALFAVYLWVGASPCIGGSAEKPAHSAHAEGHAHAHAGGDAHDTMEPAEPRGGDALEAERKLRARCPCGCEGGSAAANSFARLGSGLLRGIVDPTATGSDRGAGASIAEYTQAPARAVDHVPIAA